MSGFLGCLILLTCYPQATGLCSTCLDKRCYDNGECIIGCVPGYVGEYCAEECPSRCLKKACHKHTVTGVITCTDGCEPGYCNINCEEKCPKYCLTCDRQCGSCNVTLCSERQYGADCGETCRPRYEKCDRETGHCTKCRRGYYGDECTRECTGCFTRAENALDACLSGCEICKAEEICQDGLYGDSCQLPCSTGCDKRGRGCNRATGECSAGCVSGYHGLTCNSRCSDHCLSRKCNRTTGECLKGCVSGYHGVTCNNKCNRLCVSGICNQHNSRCTSGCISGYKSYLDTCEKDSNKSSYTAVAIIATIFLVVGISITVVIVRRRRDKCSNKEKTDCDLEHLEPLVKSNLEETITIRDLLKRTQTKIESLTAGMIPLSAVDKVVEMLRCGRKYVTITGNAGDGKTTLGFLALEQLWKKKKMKVYAIEEPAEYNLVKRVNEECVIMFDDSFGAFTSEKKLIDKWKDVMKDIHNRFPLHDNQTKVIYILRKNVVNETRVHLGQYHGKIMDPENVVDLSSMKNKDERLKILDCYIDKENKSSSDKKERVADLSTAFGFPRCCTMYQKLKAKKPDLDIEEFFKSPLTFLDITTEVLYEGSCKGLFDLMIENDGNFDPYSVDDDKERSSLLRVIREQEGSYIKELNDGVCIFADHSYHESVLNVKCTKDPVFVVKYATLFMIEQKLTFTSDRKQKSPTQINVKPVNQVLKILAKRFRQEILKGVYNVFSHSFCENEDFCNELVASLAYSHDANDMQNGSEQCIDPIRKAGDVMLWTALLSGRFVVANTLVKAKADVNIKDETGKTPLHYLCQLINSTDVTDDDVEQTLIIDTILYSITDGSGNVNICDQYGLTALHYIFKCQIFSSEKIQFILSKCKGDLSISEQNKSTPLHYLCACSDLQIDTVDLVIRQCKGDFNKGDEYGTTPLHFLCWNTQIKFEVFLHIVDIGQGDINKPDNSGITPLHVLCRISPHIGILKWINQEGKSDSNGNTPLHYLCRRWRINDDMLQQHQVPGTYMKAKNFLGYTSLQYLTDQDGQLPWTEGMIARCAADLVLCRFKQRDKWIVVLGPAMTFNSEKVHEFLQVNDFARELTNMGRKGIGNRKKRFRMFRGTCNSPPPISHSSPTTLYSEINCRLTIKNEASFTLLQIGVVEGLGNLDTWECVSGLPGNVCVSLTGNCHRHENCLCIQVLSRLKKEMKNQVCDCVTLSYPNTGAEFTLTFGLVLDVCGGKVAFINLERMKLLCTVDLNFTQEVFLMFSINFDKTCPTIMRLVSGREISVTEEKLQLIKQALK